MENKSSKISPLQIVVFIVSFAVAYFAVDYFFSRNEATPNEMLVTVSKEMNKTMPKMVDAETRLDSTSVENSTLNYHYTLVNVVKDSTEIDLDEVKNTMKSRAQMNIDTNEAMKDYRENDLSLQYIFVDKEQNKVFDYTVKHQKTK
ncbi:hypothetical protein FLAN108750_04160 [Flavobacterium antarcticum]|uniref:hypothetical protein n=1 Tax=Flavobacterium antarcticum TaxID=271155 RepID=UPI0003B3B844|nr:hypothetical protein [Flavobacterium antarcticum]